MEHVFNSRKPLIICVEKQLIGEHLASILQKGNHIIVYTCIL